MLSRLALVAALGVVVPLAPAPQSAKPWALALTPLPSVAAAESGQPQLTVSARGILLSWIERSGQTAMLKFAERTASGWTDSKVVASGADWFVNWADVPSVMRLDEGILVGHWLQTSGSSAYSYDVKLSRSGDDGRTWSPAFTPHSDGTKTEHGFASLLQMPGGGLGLLWLDGRASSSGGHHGGAMSLRFAQYDSQWKQRAETAVDLRVCDCCPTAAVVTADGPVVVFRDRSDSEVRDIAISRFEGNKWSAPSAVHDDNWKIQACPVNGPAMSASGRKVVVAWFTAVQDRPQALLAFSNDAGRTFGPPIRLDDGVALGRVDVEILADGSAVAAYVEQVSGRAQFRIRRVEPNGHRSATVVVAGLDAGRTSGYPRIAVHDGNLTAAWVERDGSLRVKTAGARLP
jgi:hypothetical protein